MSSILKIENLKYKDILKNISLSLEEKSFNILAGSNSSGKTTLVKCIIGLVEYDGEIIFQGSLMHKENIKELIKNIGVITEENALLKGTSIYNIIYSLLNLKYEEDQAKKKAYSISKKLGIDNILFKNIEELSLSEKKMVSFASSIVHDPKLIIIDDSYDELDSNYRGKIVNYLKSQSKSTILFITNHETDFLLADNLIFMKDGKIVFSDNLSKILDNEKIFVKNGIKPPFLLDLSYKLESYELINGVILDLDEMVNAIWK